VGGVADAAREACLPVHDDHDEDVRRSQRWTVFETPSTPGCLLAVRWILCGRDRRIARDDSSSSSRDLGVRWVAFTGLAYAEANPSGQGRSSAARPSPGGGFWFSGQCTVYRRRGGRCL